MTSRIDFYDAKEKYGQLSNYFVLLKPIMFKGKSYASSECLYQSMKFMYDGASEATLAYAEVVRQAKTPNMSKILATLKVGGGYEWRLALNPIIQKAIADGVKRNPDWDKIKDEKMETVLQLKFQQSLDCREILLSTGDALLAEHTSRDSYWGDGGASRSGKNVLGNLLMKVRTCFDKKRKFDEPDEETKKIKTAE